MHPASYYTELKPKDELLEKYTEYVPMSKYSTLDQQSDWFNKDWKGSKIFSCSVRYFSTAIRL